MTDEPVSTAEAMSQLLRTSAMLKAEASQDLTDATEALLERAAAAQLDGDEDRAERLVRRAKALGRDDHNEAEACSMAAHMALFNLVTDVCEEVEDESVWLKAAENVLRTARGAGREQLLEVLLIIRAEYDVDPDTRRVLDRLTRGAQRPVSVFEGRDLEVDEVLQVLAVTTAYDDAVADLLAEL